MSTKFFELMFHKQESNFFWYLTLVLLPAKNRDSGFFKSHYHDISPYYFSPEDNFKGQEDKCYFAYCWSIVCFNIHGEGQEYDRLCDVTLTHPLYSTWRSEITRYGSFKKLEVEGYCRSRYLDQTEEAKKNGFVFQCTDKGHYSAYKNFAALHSNVNVLRVDFNPKKNYFFEIYIILLQKINEEIQSKYDTLIIRMEDLEEEQKTLEFRMTKVKEKITINDKAIEEMEKLKKYWKIKKV